MTEAFQIHPAPEAGVGELSAVLQATLPLLTRVLDAVPARVVVLDVGEKLVWANHEFFKFTGLHPRQVLQQPIGRIVGDVAYAAYAGVRERMRGGQTVAWEGWTDLAGMGRRYMREHLVPVEMKDGVPQATIVMSLDLTELKLREAELSAKVAELEATEALKSSIFDNAMAALVSTDETGHIVEFNPAAATMFGLAREQALGRSVAEVMIPERLRGAHDAGMARVSRGGEQRVMGRRVEMPALRADGSEFPVEMVLWRTGVGTQTFYTASLFDLSERETSRNEIERQREALRQSEKLTAMGSLLAGVAHELNNPLSIVMGRAALLAEKMSGSPLATDAQRIHEAAERCGRIVRTFLNMARSRPANRSEVALNDLATAAIDMLAYVLRSHGINVTLDLLPGLPPVKADADQVGQIVLNLIVNAQQALGLRDHGRRLTVSTGLAPMTPGDRRRSPRIWLRVRDNGPGIPVELRERVFEPFFTTKSEGVGTGLGLAVSRSIARDHGGELTIQDDGIDGGACFCLQLPVSGEPEPGETEPAPLAAADDCDARLLVVDDEPEIAELLGEMLSGAGYEVMTAESGAVALAMLEEARFDAIISDLHMPELDGAGLWREVKRTRPALARRMLFVTGDTLSPTARQFLDEARCDSLNKPFAKAELLARVTELLKS
ncbi:PAS domain S-box protein [Roseateles asaccharophilus]|uniref:histidine kinase n=1 Tax=Roseateles asaccharophilus TaxID=582607 RepID=A0ABU2A738_9BURK|nr:PAS domain S-box protein [Roseateles asaccharophilus]MDR7333015.1 two-component system NtrC family sensor kinase [Roseateles asaccharophilus]